MNMLGGYQTTNKSDHQSSTFALSTFPQRVYCILKLVECTHQQHIISWMDKGTAFRVHDSEAFEREFLHRYFNIGKYTSFTRSLHAHGFKCQRTGRQPGIYSHPWFNRNDPETLHLIQRTSRNNKNHAKAAITDCRISASSTSGGARMNNRLQIPRQGLLRREGEGTSLFLSLLEDMTTSRNADDRALMLGELNQTVRSQVSDRTTKTRSSLPVGSQLVSLVDRNTESVSLKPSHPEPFAPPYTFSRPSYVPASSNMIDHQAGGEKRSIARNHWWILDDQIQPISLGSIADTQGDQKQSAKIPLETQHPPDSEAVGFSFNGISMIEPRSIEEMKQRPDDLKQYRG